MPTAAEVQEIVERVRRVPDSGRSFVRPMRSVARLHRIPSVLLNDLLDAGLPHRGTGQDRQFDRLDLANISLWLGLPCAQRQVMRWWSKAMASAAPGQELRFRVGIAGACPSPGHDGGCEFALEPQFEMAVDAFPPTTVSPGSYTLDVSLRSEERYFDQPFDALIEPASRLWFHYLPDALSRDLGFVTDTGLADCHLATRHLVGLAQGLGLPVRQASGYFLTPPYGTVHFWPEFHVNDQWWPADPFMLTSLARWGVLDAQRWPPNRSPQGFFWRLGSGNVKVLRHQGKLLHLQPTVSLRR